MSVSERVLDLYRGAYQSDESLPDLHRMKQLLDEGEDLDEYNPFFPSDAEFWSFHENRLSHIDLEHVLPPFSETEIGKHAMSAVGILVAGGCVFKEFKEKEEGDLRLAVIESLLFGEYEKYGVSSSLAIRKAAENDLIDKEFLEGLTALRDVVESRRYPTIWTRILSLWDGVREKRKKKRMDREKSIILERLKRRDKKGVSQPGNE